MFSDDPELVVRGVGWIITLILLGVVVWVVRAKYLSELERQEQRKAFRKRAFQLARENLTALNRDHLGRCDALVEKSADEGFEMEAEEVRAVLICDVSRIERIVEKIWGVVNAIHNVSEDETARLNFEVTVFARSIKDDLLTIPAWRNREQRKPPSLLSREAGDERIYDATEAARMIREREVETRVIPDTAARDVNYNSLYDGQKKRIRSSVLHPVVSPAGAILAVIVLHCEKENFFSLEDQRYWHELFSMFSPLVALELEKIAAFNRVSQSTPDLFPATYAPF